MKEVGLEALVKGLAKFLGDMGKINSSLDRVRSHGTLLQKAFGTIGDAMSAFGGHVVRIAEYALGKLLADAIQWVTRTLGELIQSTIEAGAEFQILELRLERLNFNDLVNSGMEYNEAMAEAAKLTKEQLDWIQKLAAATPYDAQDIANVYTLARSYSFNAEAASGLTETIIDFAAGMGLGNTEIERIIVNLGQMVQQGKVTGREMTDLARGAFVPVNDILKRMQENTGLTGAEFESFRNTGEGVNAFLEAFTQIVEERFAGASERMAQTFKGATDNMKDLVKSMLGMNVVRPILDAIGKRLSGFVSLFTDNEDRWNAMVKATTRIGEEMVKILDAVFGLLPEGEELADGFVAGLNGIADWLSDHRDDIVDFFISVSNTIKNDVIPFVRDQLIPAIAQFVRWILDNKDYMLNAIERIGTFIHTYIIRTVERIAEWVNQNRPMIDEFFKSLVDIIARVIQNLTGQNVEGGTDFLSSILSIIQSIMTFINENKAGIADFIAAWIRLSIILDVIKTIFSFLIGVVIGVVTVVAKLTAAFIFISNPIGGLIVLITFLLTMLLAFGKQVGTTIGQIVYIFRWMTAMIMVGVQQIKDWLLGRIQSAVQGAVAKFEEMKAGVVAKVVEIAQSVQAKFTEIKTAIATRVEEAWNTVKAKFASIRDEVVNRVTEAWNTVKAKFASIRDEVVNRVTEAWKKVQSIDWAKVGAGMISGMVQGVLSGAASLIDAVVGAAVSAYEAALAALGIASPSKLFMEVGELTMEGMAIGIRRAAGLAAEAMGSAMSQVAMPAVALPSVAAGASAPTQVYNSTRNYNLSIQTSAASEPIIQDFNMLESLGG
jgi:tape measure domain-containing protein